HDRAAGEAPDPAVNHPHPEACRSPARGLVRAAEATAAATTASTPAAAPAASAAASEVAEALEVAVASVGVDARVGPPREPDVGVRAAGPLRFRERHIRQALELRFE